MKPWHEQDEFWETFAPVLFAPERWELSGEQVDQVVAMTEAPPGATVLDLACGPGRHALELARRGFKVTGVDRTPSYLDEAQAQAEKDGLEIEWVHADMRTFRRPDAYELAVNLFTAFGYFEDPAEDRAVAKNLVDSLRPGGTLLMDLIGKEILARVFTTRDWHTLADGTLMLEERKVCSGWDWIENRWILVKDGRTKEFHLSHRLYSAAELAALLKECGCETVKVYGGLDGRPYDHEAKRLTLLGRKAS